MLETIGESAEIMRNLMNSTKIFPFGFNDKLAVLTYVTFWAVFLKFQKIVIFALRSAVLQLFAPSRLPLIVVLEVLIHNCGGSDVANWITTGRP